MAVGDQGEGGPDSGSWVDCRSVLGVGRLRVGRKEGCRTDASG